MNSKKILCLDFDGVCHSYESGWKGADVIPDAPVAGLFTFIKDALSEFDICIYSSRSNQPGGIDAMKNWFVLHAKAQGLNDEYYDRVLNSLKFPTEKPPAFIGIDDRVITFRGTWPNINELKAFKPWNKE